MIVPMLTLSFFMISSAHARDHSPWSDWTKAREGIEWRFRYTWGFGILPEQYQIDMEWRNTSQTAQSIDFIFGQFESASSPQAQDIDDPKTWADVYHKGSKEVPAGKTVKGASFMVIKGQEQQMESHFPDVK